MATGTNREQKEQLIKWLSEGIRTDKLRTEVEYDSDGAIVAFRCVMKDAPRRTLVDDPRRTRPL